MNMRLLSNFRKHLIPLRLGFVAAEPGIFHSHRLPESVRGSRATFYVVGAIVIGFVLIANAPRQTGEDADREQLQHQAEAGSARAQLHLGLAYRDGRYGLARDLHGATDWFARAANSGDDYAAALLGDAYAEGKGVAKDPATAQQWWRQAALAGNAHAESQLGQALLGQTADSAARDEGQRWLARAATQGDVQARHALGIDTPIPDRIPTEIDRDLGVTQGHSFLGNLYRLIMGETSGAASADTLKQRALAGDATAQYQLAMRYRDGAWGVDANPKLALGWLKQSANHGNPVAMTTLAHDYESGRDGLAPDAKQAVAWRQRAEAIRAVTNSEDR